jgi:hypothetical protein
MERYEPEVDGGTLFLVRDDHRVEVGSVDDVVDAAGGETYRIEYDDTQRTQPWLDTDDGALDVDVRDSVTSMTHTPEFVAEVEQFDMRTDRYGLPTRTVEFADRFVDILDEQGTES